MKKRDVPTSTRSVYEDTAVSYISPSITAKILSTEVKPFVKWAGGKKQLLPLLRASYPKELGTTITKYAEPFVGAGAVLFDILSNYKLTAIYISDINSELINTYIAIRDNCTQLLKSLETLRDEYLPLSTEERKQVFYEKRERYNFIKSNKLNEIIEMAALFIFLNRTCFNGLYRVNSKGLFNVPIGSYKNPKIFDEDTIRAISQALQDIEIVCGDYRDSLSFIDESTFVYFDPPYRPLTSTASFTSYSEFEFNDKEQIELADYFKLLDSKHAKLLLSNSDPKNADADDTFFDDLYSGYTIKRIEASRMINSNASARGKIHELLISNYLETEK